MFLKRTWFLAFLINLLISVLLFTAFSTDLTVSFPVLLLSLGVSLLAFALAGVLQLFATTRAGRLTFALAIGLISSLLYAATFFIYFEFKRFIATDDLRFITEDLGSLAGYMKLYLTGVYGVLFLALWAFLSTLWYWGKQTKRPDIKTNLKRALSILLLFLLILAGVADSRLKRAHYFHFVTADIAFFTSLRNVITDSNLERIYTSAHRLRLNPTQSNEGINVLLIVNESFAKYGLAAYRAGEGRGASPFLSKLLRDARLRENGYMALVFNKAYASSCFTTMSLATMSTGVSIERGMEKLHEAPLLWGYAKAAGMFTLLVSAQNYDWQNLYQFLLGVPIDYARTPEYMSLPQAHFEGVDDLSALDYLREGLIGLEKGKNFFAVYNSNALHSPFQETSDNLKERPNFEIPYENALWIVDKAWEKIFAILKEVGAEDNTVVIFTSDHGEYLFPGSKKIPRMYTLSNKILNIPFFWIIPEKFAKKNPKCVAFMLSNRNNITGNLDIIPTISDMLGVTKANPDIEEVTDGYSLCREIPEERYMISARLGKQYANNPADMMFSIYTLYYSFIRDKEGRFSYFDMKNDIYQKNNLWDNMSLEEKAPVLEIINNSPNLREIYEASKQDAE